MDFNIGIFFIKKLLKNKKKNKQKVKFTMSKNLMIEKWLKTLNDIKLT